MFVSNRQPISCSYRVEVSGWDASAQFFVEKSELAWDELSGKHVVLNHALREGAIVFVRLERASLVERSGPVAYEAELVGSDAGGKNLFRLNQVQPRTQESAMLVH